MDEEDIEIEFRPVKRIIIFEKLRLSSDNLFKRIGLITRIGQPLALHWAEGIVFFFTPFRPECDTIVEEAMKGNMYWASVMYASMPQYEPIRKIGGIEIPIVDQTPNPYLRQVAEWLKKREE